MDVSDNHFESKRIVFVTVGTTSFDSLVRTVDTDQVKKELSKKGYTHLIIQMGRGSYIPNKSSGEDGSLVVDYFTFSSSIADYLRSASLVISHAGSGSIFETLRLGKPLIVVVNEDLMDNHQSELAEELAERKHLFCGRPQTLYQVIEALDLDSIVPYQSGDASPVAKLINRVHLRDIIQNQAPGLPYLVNKGPTCKRTHNRINGDMLKLDARM
ncbi:UDP-N-acetylglucosamine transferase subunit ALG13 homolog isoform X1 [Cynara cardunculus var. scolymus]|uniref:UDP-N-acetylglucosamine transferase subunit ALG13 homolog isoform X1 n=1 Tax=Cynara cardunculus var. scolymus TaxID=59895 RepID=UPI000D622EC2|nr:UDP-N-acetylglucosamine transferase subunit ALG13 homolog isoform X1 [Cynara cardunculus var. scolymus]XP_024965412.1 UDP-N-acetylglucosamine transferase subunit ALG13 homolog isoform X1 [Cynara cardunculus var. scolymus]